MKITLVKTRVNHFPVEREQFVFEPELRLPRSQMRHRPEACEGIRPRKVAEEHGYKLCLAPEALGIALGFMIGDRFSKSAEDLSS